VRLRSLRESAVYVSKMHRESSAHPLMAELVRAYFFARKPG